MKELDLMQIRDQLDVIDGKIIEMFEDRMELCKQVAAFKVQTGKPVFDSVREQEKIHTVRQAVEGHFNQQAVEELFSQIMTISRRYQYQIINSQMTLPSPEFKQIDQLPLDHVKVVYQGIEGAYTHGAVLKYFGEDADAYHVKTWEAAMKAVEAGEADYAVLPIENSSAGAVTDNYDLLVKYHNYIVGETFLTVEHSLLGVEGAQLSDIKVVYSHPQALMQCSEYLNEHTEWQQISVENTAIAAKKVLTEQDRSQAAVASVWAGELYGLKSLACGINHNRNNTTRFIIVSRSPIYKMDANKISICFELPHKSGSLYNMLGNFIYNGVNMIKIESRPILGKNWEYRFFVDLEGNLGDTAISNALNSVKQEASYMRILGNY